MAWLHNLLLTIISVPLKWLVKVNSIPADIETELRIDTTKPIIYLLRTHSVTDQFALKMSTKALGLPKPSVTVHIGGQELPACLFLQQPRSVLTRKVKITNIADDVTRLFQIHREHPELDLQIVPVSIFWGRAPGRKSSGWSDIIANQVSPSWLRKFFIVLFLGRDNFVCYSKAVSSRTMADLQGSDEEIGHKLIRLAGTHFQRRRQNLIGPMLLERQALYNSVLGADSVRQAVSDEARGKKRSNHQVQAKAKKYVDEIAADYREGLVRIGARLLTKIWNKVYNGIEVKHADKVRALAQNGHEIIYVPCHRSHMDYLLLTYVIYHEGLVTPHIAAGINLNFWPVGGILRKGGAFFLRRSFAGNKLYTAVFREYLELLFNKGYSVKYYPEGGRSRTGRLLPPKTGMLAMTLQALVKGINRPVSIVPVYIGYEHVMEVSSYLKELKGTDKKKESFFQVFSAVRKLKNYGSGFLNFGEPINLNNFLDTQVPDWRDAQSLAADKKPRWLTPTVNTLANDVMGRINQAAAVSGMSLCAMCLLSAKKHAMAQDELERAIDDYLALLKAAPYSDLSTIPPTDGKALLESTLKLNKLSVSQDSFGKIISLKRHDAVALTYYRNNILHLFALPGLVSAIVFAYKGLAKDKIIVLVGQLYPLLQRELFMYMSHAQAMDYTDRLLSTMLDMGLLRSEQDAILPPAATSKAFYSSWLLNRSIQETLQRYAAVLTILKKEQTISRGRLEKQSREFAERLAALHGINSPEFFDKNVLSTFIHALKDNELINASSEGQLEHSEASEALLATVENLISPEITQRLQQI
ncbi:glycerol-3-phosphate 1-O-acyltransferase PlsB [Paraglaciecola polaris]|uniref:Glycerol-3-phosphate acyltransferase n=1 Tax=Paraglaciecola polaris LMG 21857 TaxID=1129793 RepID=K6ZLK7_9ALTE|nr:glycerol-3-phosphate 1-O-acyltransferase PlsB [Paraglaciecola polaris]GAC31222.1 glycerol-3-phosphate O-acyltransferase [Paraglaciecola polaris LMG 21857]|tara:strand:- start:54923 stop:57358 length:2436 start_codon:yes stop_codon:yes gene_type:complete